jgi:hypothetical protein
MTGKILTADELVALADFIDEKWEPTEVPPDVLGQYLRDLWATIKAIYPEITNAGSRSYEGKAHISTYGGKNSRVWDATGLEWITLDTVQHWTLHFRGQFIADTSVHEQARMFEDMVELLNRCWVIDALLLARKERDDLRVALEWITKHPVAVPIEGREDLGLLPWPSCQTIARHALEKLKHDT